MEEVSVLKLRIKYTKTGVLRFIGHLDIMRLFQKAIRRAKLDVAYSKGFSPHQIISFAAPMPLGMTSEGEYFDGEFVTVTSTEDMMKRLNDTLPDGIVVLDIVELPEDAKPSMSIVSASDYIVFRNEECDEEVISKLIAKIDELNALPVVEVIKKTKTKEQLTDIKSCIYDLHEYDEQTPFTEDYDQAIYMMLASGSIDNLKPELVIEALCKQACIEYNRYDYRVHRIETYMGDKTDLKSLGTVGKHF